MAWQTSTNRPNSCRSASDRAEADWRSVDADTLHRAKEDLDRASIRLQEVAIAAVELQDWRGWCDIA